MARQAAAPSTVWFAPPVTGAPMNPLPSSLKAAMPVAFAATWIVVATTAALTQDPGAAAGAPASPAPGTPAPGTPAPAPNPDKPPMNAIEAAKDYTRRMSSDEPVSAVRIYWDVDAMLSGIFGEHLRRQSDGERTEMKRLLLTFIENVYSNPAIAAAMKQSTFADFQESPGPSTGTAAVAFNVLIQSKKLSNTLHMKAIDGKWKIFDAGTNGRMMVSAIRSQYEPQAQRVTPLAYLKAMLSGAPGGKNEPVTRQGGQQQPSRGAE